ncbi:MAG: hypothetical protein ABI895_29740 [Deltaproteobacteria bacterium]
MRSALHTGTLLSRAVASRAVASPALLVLLALAAQAKVAAACVLEPVRLHRSDASLAQIDTAPPEAPVVIDASAYRRSGLTCGQDICVANNCGDMGGVAIDLDAGDDQTPTHRMGYRLELVDGVLPLALRNLLGTELAGPTPLRVHLSFDDVPSVDATLRVIAIDAAGNESAPSEPFAVGFDGCTLAATGDQCEQSYDADAEYAADAESTASGGTLVVRAELESESAAAGRSIEPSAAVTLEQPSFDAEQGCSLPGPAPSGSPLTPAVLSAALLGCLLARRRR